MIYALLLLNICMSFHVSEHSWINQFAAAMGWVTALAWYSLYKNTKRVS